MAVVVAADHRAYKALGHGRLHVAGEAVRDLREDIFADRRDIAAQGQMVYAGQLSGYGGLYVRQPSGLG